MAEIFRLTASASLGLPNVDGNTDIFLHDLAHREDHCPAPAQGSQRAFRDGVGVQHDGARLLYYHNGPDAPNDVWVYHDCATGKSHQLTHSLIAGMRSEDMVEPLPGALSQQGRQVDDFCVCLRAVQHAAQRAESRRLFMCMAGQRRRR